MPPDASKSPRIPGARARAPCSARATGAKSASCGVGGGRVGGRAVPQQPPLSSREAHRADRPMTPSTEQAEKYIRSLVVGTGQEPAGSGKHAVRDWTLVQEIDALDDFVIQRRRLQQEKMLQVQNAAELKEQAAARVVEKRKLEVSSQKWREEAERDLVAFQQEQLEERAQNAVMLKQLAEACREQAAACRQQKEATRLANERSDREAIAAATAEAKRLEEQEKERQRLKKEDIARSMHSAIQYATEKREQERLKQKKDEEEYLKELMVKEAQAANEQKELEESKIAKQKALFAKFEDGVGAARKQRELEEGERIKRYQVAVAEKEQQLADRRRQKKMEMWESTQEVNKQQVQEREEARQRRLDEGKRLAEEERMKRVQAEEEDRQAKEDKRRAVKANAAFLQKQMEEKASRTPVSLSKDQMGDVERLMNRKKLERATDPNRPDGLRLLLQQKRAAYRIANAAMLG